MVDVGDMAPDFEVADQDGRPVKLSDYRGQRGALTLDEGDQDRIKKVYCYERLHKNRAGVVEASERELGQA